MHHALEQMLQHLREGMDVERARDLARPVLSGQGTWDYLDLVDMETFEPLRELRAPAFVIGAARFGTTRLLDNMMVTG